MANSIFLVLIVVLWITWTGIPSVVGQDDNRPSKEKTGSTCNETADASGCEEESNHPNFLMQVLIIAGTIAGIILILSVVVCVCHCVHKSKNEGTVDIEASSEFEMSEDASVHFRRLDGVEANRAAAASVFSWGSEFSDGDKRGDYQNPEVMTGIPQKSRGQIYANTLAQRETTPSQVQMPDIYTNVNQYANIHGDKRTSDSSDEDYTKPLPQ